MEIIFGRACIMTSSRKHFIRILSCSWNLFENLSRFPCAFLSLSLFLFLSLSIFISFGMSKKKNLFFSSNPKKLLKFLIHRAQGVLSFPLLPLPSFHLPIKLSLNPASLVYCFTSCSILVFSDLLSVFPKFHKLKLKSVSFEKGF